MRKIIQISTDSQPETRCDSAFKITVALCDDGTLWELEWKESVMKEVWTRLPDIPQDNPTINYIAESEIDNM